MLFPSILDNTEFDDICDTDRNAKFRLFQVLTKCDINFAKA